MHRPALDKPCRIMVAPNGARRTKADHPALPVTATELAETARLCADAGATAIHVHARDGKGAHTLGRQAMESALLAVRRAVGDRMLIQMTTEAVGRYTAQQQIQAVQTIKPQAVSLALREIIGDDAFEPEAADFFAWLDRSGIETQYILYTPEEVHMFERLRQRGLVPDHHKSVLFVLGRYLDAGEVVEPPALQSYLAAMESDLSWMVCAFGAEETACLTTAICLGGDVRVGFENSLWLGDGSLAPSNEAKVAEIERIARTVGRRLA